MMNRSGRKKLGLETVRLLDAGRYDLAGQSIDFAESLARAVSGTREYTNDDRAPDFPPPTAARTDVLVRNESSLAGAGRLHEAGHRVAVLNFASANNPGGGFLNGSRAQEESLAMATGLYACLQERQMYAFHRPTRGGMYTPWAIYSPNVPVIRDEAGGLLAEPYPISFISSPAPNAGVVLKRDPSRGDEVRNQLKIRIDKVLSIAAHHEHDALVLGAWGCGVFQNDPKLVSELFALALSGRFMGMFERVVFAILDHSSERRFITPFEEVFGAEAGPQAT